MKARIWRDETLGAEYDDVEIPAELLEQAKEYREKMVEAVAECDDAAVREVSSNGEALTEDEIIEGLRRRTIALKIFPVICGTAFKNKGVQNMLDAVVDYLPSPLDVPPVEGHGVGRPGQARSRARPDDNEPFSALVFKIMTDPFVGQLAFFRVYSGKLKTRRFDLQRGQGPQGAHRPPGADARQQARGDPGDPGRRHLRRAWV